MYSETEVRELVAAIVTSIRTAPQGPTGNADYDDGRESERDALADWIEALYGKGE